MNTFCDWLFGTIVISVYDSFFRNYISIVLLSFIVLTSQPQRLFIYVGGDPHVTLLSGPTLHSPYCGQALSRDENISS